MAKIEEMIFTKKKYKEAKDMLLFTTNKLKNDKINYHTLMLLVSYCLFQMKDFYEFKDLWLKLDHELILNSENEKLINLHKKLCEVWREHNESLQKLSELETRVNIENSANLEEIFELSIMYEVIEPKKAIDYLLTIIEKDKSWDNQKAIKKAGILIGNLLDSGMKKEYRDKLRNLIYN